MRLGINFMERIIKRGFIMNFGFGFNRERDKIFILSVLLSLFILVLFSAMNGNAQTSTVSATITDINGQAYVNGSYNIQYVPPTGTGSANPPIRKDTGLAITQRYSGNLDAAGAFSVAGITRTDYINPALGQWRFTICPLATSSCFSYTTPNGITTGTLSLTAELSTASVPVAVTASTGLFALIPRAYKDSQVSGNVAGSAYYNLTTSNPRWYNGSVWVNESGFLLKTLLDFNAVCDGLTDDHQAFIDAKNSGVLAIVLPAANCVNQSEVPLAANQTWVGNNTTISHTTVGGINMSATDIDNLSMSGITFQGVNGGTVAGAPTAEALLYIAGSHKPNLRDLKFKNSNGWGLKRDPGASTSPRGDHGVASGLDFSKNYYGFETTPGTGAEYFDLTNTQFTANTFPLVIDSGNIAVVNANVEENVNGVYIGPGANNGHGVITNVQSNHNTNYQWKFDSLTNGESVNNSNCYADGGVSPGIWLLNTKGIKFNDGSIDCLIQNDGATGLSEFNNNYIAGAFGDQAPTGTSGVSNLIISNNFTTSGVLWAYNNSGPRLFLNPLGLAQTLEVGTTGANNLTRGIEFTNASRAVASLFETIPNTVGTSSQVNIYVGGITAGDLALQLNDDNTVVMQGKVTAPIFAISANVTWTAGAGIPSGGSCTTAKGGSLYSRTDGDTTHSLYVCDNATGVWTAK